MKTLCLVAFLAAVLLVGGSSMSQTADRESTIAEVTEVIHSNIEWPFPEKDTTRLYATIARDSSLFIFHPDSKTTIVGYEPFRQMTEGFFMLPEMKPLGTEIKDLRVNLSASGECAWWSCLLDDWGEFNGRPYKWQEARWTGVLEKRDGEWKIVQMHFSFASDANEDEEQAGSDEG